MSLINPSILFGLGLAIIPIVLHFMLRAKPKNLVFPALRLIQVRKKHNVRRLRLRHLLLLLLRILLITGLTFAIARPSVPAANYSLNTKELFILITILLIGVIAYLFVINFWKKQQLPQHKFAYQRTLLRGSVSVICLCLVLLLLVWPYWNRIAAELQEPLPEVTKKLPVCGVFLFDTSLSMGYQLENKTRLEVAQEIAQNHLNTLPQGSKMTIAQTADEEPLSFFTDFGNAQKRIKSLELQPQSLTLDRRLKDLFRLLESDFQKTLATQHSVPESQRSDQYLREIYIFTDLCKHQWKMNAAKKLKMELERFPWIQLYFIDVGIEDPLNTSLGELKLSSQNISLGSPLLIRSAVHSIGLDNVEKTVELYLKNESGNLTKHGQKSVVLNSSSGSEIDFSIYGLKQSVTQGELRITSSDSLASDNNRFFTVNFLTPPKILIVSDNQADTRHWSNALAPDKLVQQGKNKYQCTYVSADQLEKVELDRYECICLINVAKPTDQIWNRLAKYVHSGGGLAVILGNQSLDPLAYNSQVAQTILPCELQAHLQFIPPQSLALNDFDHALFKKFKEFGNAGDLTTVDIRRYWKIKPTKNAAVVARYTDQRSSIALIEHSHGLGRTAVLTTAVDRNTQVDPEGWSDIALARWSYLAFADQLMQYLSQQANLDWNYIIGEEILLTLNQNQLFQEYLLKKPKFQQLPGNISEGQESLFIKNADQLGNYQLLSRDEGTNLKWGFSVNAPTSESDFQRMTNSEFDLLFGEKRYRIARDLENLERIVIHGRIGQELFPLIFVLILVFFCTEHLVANWFYETTVPVEN